MGFIKKCQGTIKNLIARIALVLVLFFLSGKINAMIDVTDSTSFSIITCAPGTEVYSLFGHSAIRLQDNQQQIDLVFNYGLFSFQSENFYWNFSRGYTDYLLGVQRYPNFIQEYIAEDRTVREQVLNLTKADKQKLLRLLMTNLEPENRVYRYNYFTNNCATKIRDILQEIVKGEGNALKYYSPNDFKTTYRKIVRTYLKPYAWTWLGTDVCLGLPADYTIYFWETMFLPDFLHDGFSKSTLRNDSFVSVSHTLNNGNDPVADTPMFLTPVWMFSVFLFIYLMLTYLENKKHFNMKYFDFSLYFLLGLAGIVIGFFSFISVHPTVYPNLNLLWAFPLHILFSFFLLRNPNVCWKNIYRMVFGGLIVALFLFHFTQIQYINYSLFPLFGIVLLRSRFTFIPKLRPA